MLAKGSRWLVIAVLQVLRITFLIEDKKGQLLCGTAETMCLSQELSLGSPFVPVLGWEGTRLDGVMPWSL